MTKNNNNKLPPLASSSMEALFRNLENRHHLTREEEIEWANRRDAAMQAAIGAAEQNGEDPSKIVHSPDIINEIVECNLRLVVIIAGKFKNSSLKIEDLITEGALGLMKAAQRFDQTRGVRFSTCAAWWIRQNIKRAIQNTGDTIRTPIHMHTSSSRVERAQAKLAAQGHPDASIDDISAASGLTKAKVSKILEYEKLEVLPLDAPLPSNPGVTFIEIMRDPQSPQAYEELEMKESEWHLKRQIEKIISGLSEIERTVIGMRFGLNGYEEPSTLAQIGVVIGCSGERVRQIEGIIISKCREILGPGIEL